jgi:hypothetical protein
LLDGNAGIPAGSYLGTSDAADLVFRTSGLEVARFDANSGSVILSERLGGNGTPTGAHSTSVSASRAANGDYSFAGGSGGGTANAGSFVWGDTSVGTVTDSAPNQFIAKADGGVIFNDNRVFSGTDDLVVHARPISGDADADIRLVTRSGGHSALLYVRESDGVLSLSAGGGVHIVNPVQIDGALDTKSLAVQGSASKSTAGAWKANSDARIKQDIRPVSDALDTLLKVHPVTFEYTDTYRSNHPGVTDQRYYNVVAQQFAEVFPDAVSGSGEYLAGAPKTPDNEILQVDTYPAQIVTIAAVQELAQKNADLQGTVERLLARIEKLEAARGK